MVKAPSEPLRRSLLFVPGAEPRKLERAREAAADALLLDLEDSVAPDRKADARALVAEAMRRGAFGAAEVGVRVNARETPYFEADLEAVIGAGGRLLLIPKAESVEGIVAVAGVLPAVEPPVRLLLLVESPRGIARANEIAAASPKIDGLCFGHADFSLEMGLAEANASSGIAYHARCRLVIAAKAGGVAAIDSVYASVRDEAAFREDAELGLRLGFDGKLCIHPRQAEIVNQVYTPTRERIDRALRVLEAWDEAEKDGRGVFALDGKMVDAPLVAVERRILERARRAGAL